MNTYEPLLNAIWGDSKIDLDALIAAGADINEQKIMEISPLHYAAWEGSLTMISTLIDAGANVNAKNADGNTPLHFACQRNKNIEIVQLLLETGADPSITNIFGQLPQDMTPNEEIKDLIKNFGLGGGISLKAAK